MYVGGVACRVLGWFSFSEFCRVDKLSYCKSRAFMISSKVAGQENVDLNEQVGWSSR